MSKPAAVTYFLHDAEVQRLKIGRTTNLAKRLRTLQSARGSTLRVLHVTPGDVEREWHDRFQAARLTGEWFALTDEVAQTLRSTFGLRVRAPRERVPRHDPQRAGDWLDVLHDHTGLGLRHVEDHDSLHGLPASLDDWLYQVSSEVHTYSAECADECADECAEHCGEDCVLCEEDDEAWDRLCTALAKTRNRMVGWCAPAPQPRDGEERWRDLWMVYWKPRTDRGYQALGDALAEAECAIEDTDGAVYAIRLHAVLVDAVTGEVNLDPYPVPPLPPLTDEDRAQMRAAVDGLAKMYAFPKEGAGDESDRETEEPT